ncbi:MAG: biotin transporter BioY [Rhodobacteraceae bacterium]|jgi:biotin transport system substrate-specific component|nr:biotin transporter BioY [Paracoccaceae bacterium]|tara:strand:- start:247 stop:822 length:576 start_codon:yes stop_codon:yes gene_type:complete
MALAFAQKNNKKLLKNISLVVLGTVFIALSAQVIVPFVPVPVTLQTLAVLMIGLSFGSKLGLATVFTYLLEGAVGLPVFAGGASTLALIGPTAGFLFGFLLMVYVAGLARDLQVTSFFATSFFTLLASMLLYIPGAIWPLLIAEFLGIKAGWANLPVSKIMSGFIAPFILIDIVKSFVAALLVSSIVKRLI